MKASAIIPAGAKRPNYSLPAVMAAPPEGMVRIPAALKPGPNTYACTVSGDCLNPEFEDGDTIVCDPDQAPEPGDLVAIWWRDGKQKPAIKRLTMGLPPRKWWHLKSTDAHFILMCEQLNPPKSLSADLAKVEAVHKVIHRIPAQEASYG